MKEVQDSEQGFDIEPELPRQDNDPGIEPPAFLLTSDKVRAVRFHPAKPGYEFRQVETFVEQVTETLQFLEAQLFQAQLDGHEKREEIYDLQERVASLTATIEVFRATGDPVTTSDGTYLTESKVLEQNAELAAMTVERDALVADLAAAREDADRGWAAEAELRRYMEETLKPWMESQAANGAGEASIDDAPTVDPVTDVIVEPVATAQEPVEAVDDVVAPGSPDLIVEVADADDDGSYAEKLALAVAALDEEQLEDEDWNEEPVEDDALTVSVGVDPVGLPVEQVYATVDVADLEEPVESAGVVADVSDTASDAPESAGELGEEEMEGSSSADDGWDVDPSISALAGNSDEEEEELFEQLDGESEDGSAATAIPRLSILASSPEVAVLGDQAIIRDMPTASPASTTDSAPQPAGAPLPKLLASAPEVLATEASAEQ